MRALSLCLLLTLLSIGGASTALAQNAARRAGAEAPATAGSEAPVPGASPYVRKVANGIRLAASRDLDGATSALREAVQDQPSSAMAYYYLGEVQRLRGDMETALSTFERCTSFAGSQNDALYQARCMRGKADTLERMNGRREDARTAWNDYVRFADAHRQVSSPETGRARMQAIDAQLEQARAYIEVRQRIAERERVNASSGGGNQRGQGQSQGQRR
jgi:tetratricopeptide (TPR) repeat protein